MNWKHCFVVFTKNIFLIIWKMSFGWPGDSASLFTYQSRAAGKFKVQDPQHSPAQMTKFYSAFSLGNVVVISQGHFEFSASPLRWFMDASVNFNCTREAGITYDPAKGKFLCWPHQSIQNPDYQKMQARFKLYSKVLAGILVH